MDNVRLSDLFHITKRFQRSVHLERDFYTENALEGYIVTVKVRETLTRLIAAQENGATSKAWSLTGPYGSGKSAFALFAAKLFGNPKASTTQHALELLKHSDVTLYECFQSINGNKVKDSIGFCPVLISGERAPITRSLLQGLEHGLKTFGITSQHSLQKDIQKLLKTEANGNLLQASEITKLFEFATRSIKQQGGHGLLLVIDELGKFLEYATEHPAQGDVFVLQTLAEFAARSDQTPLLLLTILHQAFEQYANKLAKSQQEEWAKIQGRFEDIAFVEPTERGLRLIGSAIEVTSQEKKGSFSFPIKLDPIKLELKPSQLNNDEFGELIRNCLPLHPIVALVIAPIFRRFAQNERSLFAFLSSNEPHGLQDFLSNQPYDGNTLQMFSIANLYDYLNVNMGDRLYASRNGKKWAEIESAVERLSDPSTMTLRLIKAIGLLGVVNEVIPNLKASESLLRYALDDNTSEFASEFETALATLKKRSIAIYRRYNKAYALWQGSDVDIEARLREAEKHINTKVTLATDLLHYIPSELKRPLVARRHLSETGTSRYFAVRYTDLANFEADMEKPLGDADGLLLYALPLNEQEHEQLIEKATKTNVAPRQDILIAIPRTITTLQDTIIQLASLRWVAENTPELDGDAAAKGELSAQRAHVEKEVLNRLTTIFGGNGKEACTWYHNGQEKKNINSQRTRNAYLSKICDDVYNETPIIQNELINRRKISGVVTTARKKLIQAILENGDKENLGITGYPPEMSIYRSLLWNTKIHRGIEGVWGFHPPKPDDDSKIIHTWNAIEAFLEKCEGGRQPITQLYEKLMAPPIGVRSEPLPILLCAAMLRSKTEIALYQDGSFIPNWSMPIFERFLKVPEKFELKRFRITGARENLLRQFSSVLHPSVATEVPDLLTVIAALIRFISRLPKYTLSTEILSENAKNFREAVLNAREPDELIFKELPEALGFSVFRVETTDTNAATTFSSTLQDTLSELGRAYENLLNSIEKQMKDAFVLTGNRDTCREALVHRAEPLQKIASDPQLIQFLTRICDQQLDFTSWIEAIGATLADKPPKSWFDRDMDIFQSNFSEVVRKFRHFEAVSYEKLKYTESAAGEPIRIGITGPNQDEQERVVTLTPTADEQTLKIADAIKQVFRDLKVDHNPELHIAILAKISQHWIQQLDE